MIWSFSVYTCAFQLKNKVRNHSQGIKYLIGREQMNQNW